MNRRVFSALAFALFASFAAPALADVKDDATAPAFAFVKAVNAGDAKAVAATGAPGSQSIIDDFAPFAWNGPDAISKWFADFQADVKKQGITDLHASLSASPFTTVEGDRAWAPMRMDYTFKVNGATSSEHGLLTFALTKSGDRWLIGGWTWGRVR